MSSIRIELTLRPFLPDEQGGAEGSGREVITSLKWKGLSELREGAGDEGTGRWDFGGR